MRKCPSCGNENKDKSFYCYSCGEELQDIEVLYTGKKEKQTKDEFVRCPNCDSIDVHFVTKQMGSDVSPSNACCGYILFGPIGLLCGFATDKTQKTVRKCLNCNHEF